MHSLYEMDDERALHVMRIEGRIGYYARFATIMKTWNDEIIASWNLELFVIDLPNFLPASCAIRKPHDSISPPPFLIPFLSYGRIRNKAEENDVKISRRNEKRDTGKNLTLLRLETFTFSISLLNNFLNIETQYRCSKRLNDEIVTIYMLNNLYNTYNI